MIEVFEITRDGKFFLPRSLQQSQGPEPPVIEALEITRDGKFFLPRSLREPQGPEPPVIEALEITRDGKFFFFPGPCESLRDRELLALNLSKGQNHPGELFTIPESL